MRKLVDVDQGIVVSARLIQLKPEGRTSARRQSRIAEAKSSDRILPNPLLTLPTFEPPLPPTTS